MVGGTIFKVAHKCTLQNYGTFLSFELNPVTSQALKIDVTDFCQHVCFISVQPPLSNYTYATQT